jgi:acyl carrier protein
MIARCVAKKMAVLSSTFGGNLMADVFAQVKEVIVEKLSVDADKVTIEASFIDDLGADSLETVELIMGLEDKFGVTIADEDAEKIRTVKDAVDYITTKQA